MLCDNSKDKISSKVSTIIQKESVFGRFGGLIIYGIILIYILSFFMRDNAMQIFLQGGFLFDILIVFAISLPIGFIVVLSMKTKGLDLSIIAMIAITFAICKNSETLFIGIILSLIACIIIGSINAIAIHFLRLPGLLVTFIMLILFSSLSVLIAGENRQHMIESVWTFVLIFISVLVAVTLAIVSSINKNPKNQFWSSIFPVYSGIGILAVLFAITSFIRIGAMVPYSSPSLLIMILFIAVFLSITRFVKNKAIALTLPLLPCLIFAIINNVLSVPFLGNYTFFVIIILLLIIFGFRKGRSHLIGMSPEKSFRAKAWVVLIPLIFILLYDVLKREVLSLRLFYILEIIGVDIILDVIAIVCCIFYIFMQPRDLMKKENKSI